jgi:hypothetical protein
MVASSHKERPEKNAGEDTMGKQEKDTESTEISPKTGGALFRVLLILAIATILLLLIRYTILRT